MDTVKALLVLVFTTFAGVFVIQGLVNWQRTVDYMLGQGTPGTSGTGSPTWRAFPGGPPRRLPVPAQHHLWIVVGATIQIVCSLHPGIVYICAVGAAARGSAAMIPGGQHHLLKIMDGWLHPVQAGYSLIYALGSSSTTSRAGTRRDFPYFLGVADPHATALSIPWSLLGGDQVDRRRGHPRADRAEGANGNGGGGGGASGAGFRAANAAQGSGEPGRDDRPGTARPRPSRRSTARPRWGRPRWGCGPRR